MIPMIAKLICSGASREDAIDGLAAKLTNINIWPVRTNSGFLHSAATHPEFRNGNVDTGFIERFGEALLPPETPSDDALGSGLHVLQWP